MEFQTIYLHFKSPVHFGDSSRGNEASKTQFSADSLWGAICFALSKLLPKNDFESLLEEFSNNAVPFRISSTYPFYKKNGDTKLFLPRPLFLIENPDFTSDLDPKLAKKIKTSKFIPLSLFEKWINQADITKDELEKGLESTQEFFENNIYSESLPKISLDRISSNNEFFHYGLTYFSEQSGLYFLIQYPNKEKSDSKYFKLIISALKYLQDTGLGGKRTWGLGAFEFDHSTTKINVPSSPDAHILLSPLIPSQNDLDHIKSDSIARWNIIERMRWTNTHSGQHPLQIPTFYMFEEGSLFQHPLEGRFLNYNSQTGSNKIPYSLNGLGFSLPVQIHSNKGVSNDSN